MRPADIDSIHEDFETFAEYAEFPVEVAGETETVFHAQYAAYPMQRLAEKIAAEVDIDLAETESYDEFRDAYCEGVLDIADEIVEGDETLHVDSWAERIVGGQGYVDDTKLLQAASNLLTLYDGKWVGRTRKRYNERRRRPETKAALVADILTLYNALLAEDIVEEHRVRGDEGRRDVDQALCALRADAETRHGWAVFAVPTPTREDVKRLYRTVECVEELPASPKFLYALHVIPFGASHYTLRDTSFRETMASARAHVGREIVEEVHGDAPDPDRRWADESTTDEELEESRRS